MFLEDLKVKAFCLGSKKEVIGYAVKMCTGRCFIITGKDEYVAKSINSHTGLDFITQDVYEIDESTIKLVNV